MARFHEVVYSDVDEPSGLNKVRLGEIKRICVVLMQYVRRIVTLRV